MKSEVYGTNEALIVDERADSDGELAISMAVTACDAQEESVHTWITKEHAERLIKHLQSVFPSLQVHGAGTYRSERYANAIIERLEEENDSLKKENKELNDACNSIEWP